ncbi:MAG: hypothetical protein ABIR70_19080 [Bryobacteraceae bacterium]
MVTAGRAVQILDRAQQKGTLGFVIPFALAGLVVLLLVGWIARIRERHRQAVLQPAPLSDSIAALEPAHVAQWLASERLRVTRDTDGVLIYLPQQRLITLFAVLWLCFPLLLVEVLSQPGGRVSTDWGRLVVGYGFLSVFMTLGFVLPALYYIGGETFHITSLGLCRRAGLWPFNRWKHYEWKFIHSIRASESREGGMIFEYTPDLGKQWTIGQRLTSYELPAMMAFLTWCTENVSKQDPVTTQSPRP